MEALKPGWVGIFSLWRRRENFGFEREYYKVTKERAYAEMAAQ
jgi:hypothetical protein